MPSVVNHNQLGSIKLSLDTRKEMTSFIFLAEAARAHEMKSHYKILLYYPLIHDLYQLSDSK